MATEREREKVTVEFRDNLAKLKREKARLEKAIAEETNPKRRKKLQKALDRVNRAEAKGLDPVTILALLKIVMMILEWWFKTKG